MNGDGRGKLFIHFQIPNVESSSDVPLHFPSIQCIFLMINKSCLNALELMHGSNAFETSFLNFNEEILTKFPHQVEYFFVSLCSKCIRGHKYVW